MEVPRCRLSRAEIVHSSAGSRRSPLPERATMPLPWQQLDFVAAISCFVQERRCAGPRLVRVLATAQGLRQRQERKSNGVSDLSRDTSSKSWKDRDLLLDSTAAAAAARLPA